MRTVYEIVRIYPNKAEEVIQTVESIDRVPSHVETPQFVGTWINDSRKILRYGRGEIRIRKQVLRPTIVGKATIEINEQPAYLLNIKYGEGLDWIVIEQSYIAGYDVTRKNELWRATKFSKLPTLIDKELAYQCMVEYDTLVDTHHLVGML